MANRVPLDRRQARFAWHLLHEDAPATVGSIAAALRLTPRTVNYNLRAVDAYMRSVELHASGGVASACGSRAPPLNGMQQFPVSALHSDRACSIRTTGVSEC